MKKYLKIFIIFKNIIIMRDLKKKKGLKDLFIFYSKYFLKTYQYDFQELTQLLQASQRQ